LFCHSGPALPRFQLVLNYGTHHPNELGAYLVPVSQDVQVSSLKFSLFDDKGIKIDARTYGAGSPKKGVGSGAVSLKFYYTDSRSMERGLALECEYRECD